VIVLDENLDEQRVRWPLAARFRGKVVSVRELRPGSVIKDDAVPGVLCQFRGATFVTTNVSDFWRRVAGHRRYCVVCVPLRSERQDEVPGLILRLFRHEALRTARQRMGKVLRVSQSEILVYELGQRTIRKLAWA
jgi:hypothetical protein